MKRTKRRGGWPKRDRVPGGLRLSPQLADWLTATAARVGRSRGQLMELWLEALREAMAEADRVAALPHEECLPDEAYASVVDVLMRRVVFLGLMNDYVALGRRWVDGDEALK